MKKALVISAAISGLLVSGPAWAEHSHEQDRHGKKHANAGGEDDDRDGGRRAAVCYFEPRDAHVITEYYAPRYRNLPPGLAKKFNRTGHLPPGWQRKMAPIPVVVERQLVVLPADYRRGVIDGYAVVYNPRTQVIVDIMAVFGR